MNVWSLGVQTLLALVLAVFGAGCDDEDSASTVSTTASASADIPGTSVSERIVDDLANRLGVPRDGIDLVERCAVTWPDGSIGVAEPGQVYTQSLVEGWLVILEAEGEEYRYHGADFEFIAANFVHDATVDPIRC